MNEEWRNKLLFGVLRGVKGEGNSVLKFLPLIYFPSLRYVLLTYNWTIIIKTFPQSVHDIIKEKQAQNSLVPFFWRKKVWKKVADGLTLDVRWIRGNLYCYCLNILQYAYISFTIRQYEDSSGVFMLPATVFPGPGPILKSLLMFWLEPLQVASKEQGHPHSRLRPHWPHSWHTLVPKATGELPPRELFLENGMYTLSLDVGRHPSEMMEEVDFLAPTCLEEPLSILADSMGIVLGPPRQRSMDIGGSYIFQSFMVLHIGFGIRKRTLKLTRMAKFKILTIPWVDKDVEQLNCLAVLCRVKHIST